MPKNPRMETTDLVPICCTQKLECIEIRVELYPPKRYIEIPTLGTCECEPFQDRQVIDLLDY